MRSSTREEEDMGKPTPKLPAAQFANYKPARAATARTDPPRAKRS